MWAARDRDGDLYLYKSKPKRGLSSWLIREEQKANEECIQIFSELLPGLVWSCAPIEVGITVVKTGA